MGDRISSDKLQHTQSVICPGTTVVWKLNRRHAVAVGGEMWANGHAYLKPFLQSSYLPDFFSSAF